MATAQQVIDRAGGYLRILNAAGDAVDATRSADMLTYLQDMIAEWAEDAVLEIPAPSALSDDLEVSEGTLRAIAMGLAMEYAEVVGKALSPRFERQALRAKARLISYSTLDRSVKLDDGGMMVSSGRYNITTDA